MVLICKLHPNYRRAQAYGRRTGSGGQAAVHGRIAVGGTAKTHIIYYRTSKSLKRSAFESLSVLIPLSRIPCRFRT